MNLSTLNKYFDRYVRRFSDLDIFITSPSWDATYKCNVIIYPDKYLKNGSDYSSNYHNMLDHPDYISNTIKDAFSMFGMRVVSSNTISFRDPSTSFSIKYIVSDDLGDYLNGYIKKALELLKMFPDSDYLPEWAKPLYSGATFTLDDVDFSPPNDLGEYDSELMVGISINLKDSNSSTLFSREVDDFLSNNMQMDPQINFRYY